MAKEFKAASKLIQGDTRSLLGIQESDETAFRFDSYNISNIFNVKAYGATGDGVTDDTTSIQSAIDAVEAQNGGVVYFPVGHYIIGGALVGGGYNAQLVIHPIEFATGNYDQIRFIGECPPSKQGTGSAAGVIPQMRTGVIIESTIDGSGTRPAIFGTIKYVTNNFNNRNIFVRNMRVISKVDVANKAQMTGFNFERATAACFEHVVVGLNITTASSAIPNDGTCGIFMPIKNSNTNMTIKNCLVSGYKHGYVLSEHTILLNAEAFNCYYAWTQLYNHHYTIALRFLSQWCKYDLNTDESDFSLSYPGTLVSKNISACIFNVEYHSDGDWWDNTETINDPSNLLRGSMAYHIGEPTVGINNSRFSKSGGTDFTAYEAAPQDLSAAIEVTGSTGANAALQNLLTVLENRGIIIDSTT